MAGLLGHVVTKGGRGSRLARVGEVRLTSGAKFKGMLTN